MILNVIDAKYKGDYKIDLKFDNGRQFLVDLQSIIFNEKRNIFQPLNDIDYFRKFEIRFNTVCWQNEADFAPEFLYEIGENQNA